MGASTSVEVSTIANSQIPTYPSEYSGIDEVWCLRNNAIQDAAAHAVAHICDLAELGHLNTSRCEGAVANGLERSNSKLDVEWDLDHEERIWELAITAT